MLEETGLTPDDIDGVAANILNLMRMWLQGDVYRVEVYDWCGDVDIQEWDKDSQPSDVEDWEELDSLGGLYGLNYTDLESVKYELNINNII